jgi:hypothetical protein
MSRQEAAAPPPPPVGAAALRAPAADDGVAAQDAAEHVGEEEVERQIAPSTSIAAPEEASDEVARDLGGVGSGYGGGAGSAPAPAVTRQARASKTSVAAPSAPAPAEKADDGTAAIEAEIAAATRQADTDPIGAAVRLSRSIRHPADAGQRAAIAAATWTLDHGRPDLAAAYAERGLSLGRSGALADLLRALAVEAAQRQGEGTPR